MKKAKPKIKKKYIIAGVLIFIFILIICECIRSANFLKVTKYSLNTDKIDGSLHFVFISDLHNKEFGEDNKELIEAIEAENPQFVCVGGDMVTRDFEDDSVMKNLFTQLAKSTPVYCCLGNHERDLEHYIDFKSDIESTGAVLLDNEMLHLEIVGEEIIIGGLSDYPYYEYNKGDEKSEEAIFLEEFLAQGDGRYSILLNHQPEYFSRILNENDIDLMLSGHTHGGLIQIPFVGGVIAPNQGLFPKYDIGLFAENSSTMIITSGLGVSNPVPRFNNPPEICVIDVN